MNISTAIVVILIVFALIGRIGRFVRGSQAKRDDQQKPYPYRENQSQATAAHETAAKPGMWKGVDSFRQMLERLEEAAGEEQKRKDPSVNFDQAFEAIEPIPKSVGPRNEIAATEGMVSTQGRASSEGTFSTQGRASSEGTFSTQGMASMEGGPVRAARASVLAQGSRAQSGYFAGAGDLRRAIIMSEVLGKPVSLRRRRTI